jgi:amino acid transporter
VTTYRVDRPHSGILPLGGKRFEATEFADARTGWRGRLLNAKDVVIGTSMSSARLSEERLSKRVALAIFSSDALSSTAYATQEILIILVLAGASGITFSLPIAAAITLLLGIVVVSYRQTIRAYPNGGGAYIVAHENIGMIAGLVAASSLLIDYVLTVSVSIAACVEAIYSAAPSVHDYAVPLAVALVGLIALGNLRGLRESGTLFSIPTYGFIVILASTITLGLFKILTGDTPNVFTVGHPDREIEVSHTLTLFLILRAFSAGCTALTGVEAISNGVSAFKPPESRNAATTMTAMALILGALFLGTTLLARHYGVVYLEGDRETIMSQIGRQVFGNNLFYYSLQAFTAGILFLAANTSYNGFPLLGAILARDGYLPRLFHQRGNRLVFSYGIAALTFFAILLLVVFNASTTRLIPLYALGVFLSFTLAQGGMVRRWLSRKEPGWQRSALISGLGAVATCVVFFIILVTKFTTGGWMIVALIPILTIGLWWVGRFYARLKRTIYVNPAQVFDLRANGRSRIPVLVPVEDINLATVVALDAACQRSSEVTAVHVNFDPEDEDELIKRWDHQFPGIPLIIIESPHRTVAEPFSWYIADRLREYPNEVVIIMPQIKVRHWYQRPMVNQSLGRLRKIIGKRRRVEFVDQPYAVG